MKLLKLGFLAGVPVYLNQPSEKISKIKNMLTYLDNPEPSYLVDANLYTEGCPDVNYATCPVETLCGQTAKRSFNLTNPDIIAKFLFTIEKLKSTNSKYSI